MKSLTAETRSTPYLALAAFVLAALAPPEKCFAQAKNVAKSEKALEGLIVDPDAVTATNLAKWKNEGINLLVLTLDERFAPADYKNAARLIAADSLDLYYWVEVGRNPSFAREHPEWMASFGMHDDWRTRFPETPSLKDGEVAKVWPWTPIGYREAYDAHLSRIADLVKLVPTNFRGLLLNDLQGGPSSCGCGNLQCRWAIDYDVPSTAAMLDGADVAARFVAHASELVAGKEVIPVWTTECEARDLATENQPDGGWSTGHCGHVECFVGQCPIKFAEQWQALHATHRGPTGVLLLHKEFQRDRKEYGIPGNWIVETIEGLDPQKPTATPRKQLWVVVQGYDVSPDEEAAAKHAALRTKPGAVLVARARIDQSFEPRVMKLEPK